MNIRNWWRFLGRAENEKSRGKGVNPSPERTSKCSVPSGTVDTTVPCGPSIESPGIPVSHAMGIAAAASKGNKNPNQDAFLVSDFGSRKLLCIADGVGSAQDAHLASRLVVAEASASVGELLQSKEISFKALSTVWLGVAEKLKQLYTQNRQLYPPGVTALQTTLLTVIEDSEQYWVGMLGNGSVLLVRGDFFHFPQHVWPWCVTDLFVSHQVLDAVGNARLVGYLSGEGQVGAPRFCCLRKDQVDGEFLIVTTDGVNSIDQTKELRDHSGRIAHLVNPLVISLFTQYLRTVVTGQSTGVALQAELQQALERFLDSSHFDDDATVGVLLSARAVSLYRH